MSETEMVKLADAALLQDAAMTLAMFDPSPDGQLRAARVSALADVLEWAESGDALTRVFSVKDAMYDPDGRRSFLAAMVIAMRGRE